MILLLSLLTACSGGETCLVTPAEDVRTCEVPEDCGLAYVDCDQHCTCAAVSVGEVGAVEAQSAAACASGDCASASCQRDCKEDQVATCVRGRCELRPLNSDSGF